MCDKIPQELDALRGCWELELYSCLYNRQIFQTASVKQRFRFVHVCFLCFLSCSSGMCTCKKGVYGPKCDDCHPGFFHFSSTGCQLCQCNNHSTYCHPQSGQSSTLLSSFKVSTFNIELNTTCGTGIISRSLSTSFTKPVKMVHS